MSQQDVHARGGAPGDHPDDDLLADLGAGLLAGEEARGVEAHVVGCDVCVDLLERSEALTGSLRRLGTDLSAADAMPADVAARLERVTAGGGATTGQPTDQPLRAAEKPADTGATRILKPMTTASSTRMVRPGSGARRQQITEERDEDRSFRLMRYGRFAAAAVLVIGVGVGAVVGVRSLTSGGGAAATAAGDSAASGGAVVSPVLATGTNYDEKDLKSQVTKLVATSRTAAPVQKAESGGDGAASSASRAYADSPSALAATEGSGLADDAKLADCLTAIGRGGERPVAVDLARYQDREAAVIVLQEADGTLDVWVVARTCAAGADGTIAVKTYQP